MKLKILLLLFSLIFILNESSSALNELTVRVPDIYTSYPGFIDKSTLVIEPHGGYTEQSLYLEYSDHGQFSSGYNVEVIHRFELPQGAVVNDLWLWIGDSVMKAICLDTWTARSIYDSIVSMKRDPAFLTKNGDQYELHIYPLQPGSFRKIKLNFISPTRWIGNSANIEIPFLMLNSNNNFVKPLEVLFRTKEQIWGEPVFKENPTQKFTAVKDTAGYHYKRTYFNDISHYKTLKLTFNVEFQNGNHFDSELESDSLIYFQSSFLLNDIFNIRSDSTGKKNLIGIELGSSFNKNITTLIPNLKILFKTSLKANDQFNVIISGAGKQEKLSPDWMYASPGKIDTVFNKFMASDFADSISLINIPRLMYTDSKSPLCWGFSGVELYAGISRYTSLISAANDFDNFDIIASYEQGFENVPTSEQLPTIIMNLDSFFQKGGRFVTYFDFNRVKSNEPVATHYISGLSVKSSIHEAITIYRNAEGNIGKYFPEQITRSGTYLLNYTDPDVKVELKDKDGNAIVISKKIGNGLIVVSGMWSFNDDASLKKILSTSLLGLNYSRTPSQIDQTLETMLSEYNNDPYDRAIIISNSDSLILREDAIVFANNYAQKFSGKPPVFNSINLLESTSGNPPFLIADNITYYGSGYLLNLISNRLNGIHFEMYQNDWDIISGMLSPYTLPSLEQFSIQVDADNSSAKVKDFREVKEQPEYDYSPKFFIGAVSPASEIRFNLSAKFSGIDTFKTVVYTMALTSEVSNNQSIIPAVLANEKIKEFFSEENYDTSKIVQLAVKYNLLCDYTALLALEPNDTLHFLKDPFDETQIVSVDAIEEEADSLGFSVYPNPFNSQTKISIKVKHPSKFSLHIYNILGQLVKTIAENEEIQSSALYSWEGKDSFNQSVSSGIYLTRIEIVDNYSNKKEVITKKILLVK